MPLPKRRHSKQRTRTRRATWGVEPPTLNRCRHCRALMRRHMVCKNCGYYRGRQILEVSDRQAAA